MNALQLADALAADEISVANRSVSDELRRLHAVNAQMLETLESIQESTFSLHTRIACERAIAAATGEQA